MIRRPPRSTLDRSSAASDVYKRQGWRGLNIFGFVRIGTYRKNVARHPRIDEASRNERNAERDGPGLVEAVDHGRNRPLLRCFDQRGEEMDPEQPTQGFPDAWWPLSRRQPG